MVDKAAFPEECPVEILAKRQFLPLKLKAQKDIVPKPGPDNLAGVLQQVPPAVGGDHQIDGFRVNVGGPWRKEAAAAEGVGC